MTLLVGTTNPNIIAFASIMSSARAGGFKPVENSELKEKGYLLEERDLPPGGGPIEKYIKLPYSFFEDQIKHDPTAGLKESTIPKLFMLGTRDVLAKPEVVRALYDMAGNPKKIYELDSDHDYRFQEKLIDEVNKVVGEFLDEHGI